MVDIELARGEHRRYWVLDIIDAASGQHAQLPPSDDWHKVVAGLNMLADLYGSHNVKLYQWDITCVHTDPEGPSI